MAKRSVMLFLSYASEDERSVEQLYDHLLQDGFTPWMAKRNIHPGENWERAIWRAVREGNFVLICLSKAAVIKRGFLQREIKQALEIWKEKLEDDIYLIPVRLEECSVPTVLRDFHWLNLYEPDGYDKLKKSITEGMKRRGAELSEMLARRPLGIISAVIDEKQEGHFSLNIEYPVLQPDGSTVAKQINDRLSRFALESAQKFRTEWVGKGYDPKETSLWPSLEIRYSVGMASRLIISFRFTVWSFHPTAAHPNSETRTLNFSGDAYVEYYFMDLFRNDVDYLNVISEYCIGDLHQQRAIEVAGTASVHSADEWITNGAGPKHANFEKFMLVPHGLLLIFDAYQVGSYAEGRREVLVPIPLLAEILKPNLISALEAN